MNIRFLTEQRNKQQKYKRLLDEYDMLLVKFKNAIGSHNTKIKAEQLLESFRSYRIIMEPYNRPNDVRAKQIKELLALCLALLKNNDDQLKNEYYGKILTAIHHTHLIPAPNSASLTQAGSYFCCTSLGTLLLLMFAYGFFSLALTHPATPLLMLSLILTEGFIMLAVACFISGCFLSILKAMDVDFNNQIIKQDILGFLSEAMPMPLDPPGDQKPRMV